MVFLDAARRQEFTTYHGAPREQGQLFYSRRVSGTARRREQGASQPLPDVCAVCGAFASVDAVEMKEHTDLCFVREVDRRKRGFNLASYERTRFLTQKVALGARGGAQVR